MEIIVWIGAALSAIGLCGIVYSIVAVARAKRMKLPDDELRARVAKILPINLIALFISMIGLMAVIIGVLLS